MKELGYQGEIVDLIQQTGINELDLARVIVEHKERYIIQTQRQVLNAEITGNLRFSAQNRDDFPAVGDWVQITMMDEETAIILKVLPRISIIRRQAVGKFGEKQIIATNIDYAFIVQAVGQDFNLKRIERYLSICYASKIKPVILLTKTDLVEERELDQYLDKIKKRIPEISVFPLSSETKSGFDALSQFMEAYKTYCFMGSSGVGKSSVINVLNGKEVLMTREISTSTNKGRHTTSHRELIILPNQSIVIDTPGMREIGMTDEVKGIETTYQEIIELAHECKFNDCKHIDEVGCAVLKAIDEGILDEEAYRNFQKLMREQTRFSSSIVEKRQKSKAQGKMIKAILDEKRKNKF